MAGKRRLDGMDDLVSIGGNQRRQFPFMGAAVARSSTVPGRSDHDQRNF